MSAMGDIGWLGKQALLDQWMHAMAPQLPPEAIGHVTMSMPGGLVAVPAGIRVMNQSLGCRDVAIELQKLGGQVVALSSMTFRV